MGFLNALQGLFRKKQDDDDMLYSIVMLLRSPFAMSKEVLEAAACRAYGVPAGYTFQMDSTVSVNTSRLFIIDKTR
jgi:hypothetical protein